VIIAINAWIASQTPYVSTLQKFKYRGTSAICEIIKIPIRIHCAVLPEIKRAAVDISWVVGLLRYHSPAIILIQSIVAI
jgi:hypothetical protein